MIYDGTFVIRMKFIRFIILLSIDSVKRSTIGKFDLTAGGIPRCVVELFSVDSVGPRHHASIILQ